MEYSESAYGRLLEEIFRRFPSVQKTDFAAAYKPGLEGMESFCAALGHPERAFRSIHIAGTNGKGSTAAMLASVLQEAGYKTGLYTSPHLRKYNERIRIDGKDVSDEEMCRAAEILEQCVEQMDDRPTVFERITALAMVCFERAGCEVVVLEVTEVDEEDQPVAFELVEDEAIADEVIKKAKGLFFI